MPERRKKAGVVNHPAMYPQSTVPWDACKSAVWETYVRTRWARYESRDGIGQGPLASPDPFTGRDN